MADMAQDTTLPPAEPLATASPSMPATMAPQNTTHGTRHFGPVNWLGLWTFYQKEVQRFVKVIFQTVAAPVISTLLFLLVFMLAFGVNRPDVGAVSYIVFLAPGLIMMAILTNAFANSSSSLIIGKMQGSIVDILMAPLSAAEIAAGFIGGAVTRGLLVGLITALTCAAFMAASDPLPVRNVLAVMYFALTAAWMFGTLGVLAGIWAEKFDQLSAITNFVIQPLTFLSGTFYPISRLPDAFLTASHFNPVFMLVDGFRYGFTGHAEASISVSILITLALNIALTTLTYRLLKAGYRIKT
ncbi:MAG: ABC transporter permease [Pseudomonadota bacterium]